MFPYIGFMSMVALSSGVLNTYKRFAVPAATPVLLNISTIAAAWWLAPWFSQSAIEPIFAMAVGVMVGGVLQLGLQIPALHRLGLLPRIGLSWSAIRTAWADPATKNITHLMAPALLGVSVAQISLLINTQIASHLATGSVSWLSYADRLMEFPTAMLGVALGVVLMPQLAAANASGNTKDYSALLDWGLRIVVLLAVPCAVALLLFSQPLVAVLFHYKAFTAFDVAQTALALQGWGVGLVGIVAIKVLAPGYYARQDIKTPVRIAIAVLVITQLLNWALLPMFKHAALSLSIGLGAVINALWLLVGLRLQKTYQPEPGWLRFLLQVILGAVVLAVFLGWAAQAFPWLDMPGKPLQRIGGVAAVILGAGALYLGTVSLLGLNLRQFLRR
jgi:putative peptidoglycan lipid II flippase